MSYAIQSSLPKKRTTVVKLDGGNSTAQIKKMQTNVNNWTLASVQNALRQVSVKVIDSQLRIGNEPSEMVTDGTTTKPVTQATKSVYVRFGARINKAAIRHIENTLARNIRKWTTTRTGTLSNVRKNWVWLLYDKRVGGKAKRINPYSSQLETLMPNEALLLVPSGVINAMGDNYAAAANWRVTQKQGGSKSGGVGFMGRTAKALRRSPKVKNFYYVRANYTAQNREPREVYKYGTQYLFITPRLKFNRNEIKGRRR